MARKQQVVMDEQHYNQPVEPLGKRIGRFVVLMGVIFAISAGVVVTQRLSKDALAMLLGLSCGIAAMLPTLMLGGFWLKRELEVRKDTQYQLDKAYVPPPVIVVTPQGLPGYGQIPQTALSSPAPSYWQPSQMEREFTIVGGVD